MIRDTSNNISNIVNETSNYYENNLNNINQLNNDVGNWFNSDPII